jgi:hypothetical protein
VSLKNLPNQGRRREVQDAEERVIPVVALADADGDPFSFPLSAFGDLEVAELDPFIQMKFTSGILTDLMVTEASGSGTVTAAAGLCSVSSGTTTGSIARLSSRQIVRYSPGQGVEIRYTMLFTSPVAGTTQAAGYGSPEDAFAFGYNGTAFGILHRRGGSPEIRTVTVTAAATGAGTITITLNGGAGVAVPIAGVLTIGEVAREIADADYSAEGGGWRSLYAGDRVIFIAVDTDTRGGAYSYAAGATGTAGSVAQTLAAVAATDVWTAQADWNRDPADGSRLLPVLDPTKGNVARIQLQWLGFGDVAFAIEHPVSGHYVDVHRIEYSNANTIPSLQQPDQPLMLEADNGATSSDVIVKSASMGAFNSGRVEYVSSGRHSTAHKKSIGNTQVPILSLHLKALNRGGLTNRVRLIINGFSLGNDGGKTAEFQIVLNPTLVGSPVWTDVDTIHSSGEVDTAATGLVGGELLFTAIVGAGNGIFRDVDRDHVVIMEPGDILSVQGAITSGSAANLLAAFSFIDDI